MNEYRYKGRENKTLLPYELGLRKEEKHIGI
jgi:hypothetical protein